MRLCQLSNPLLGPQQVHVHVCDGASFCIRTCEALFCFANKKMSTSQAAVDKLPKQFPFAKRGPTMIPKPKFDMHFHVTALNKYSKKIPKREPSVIDRSSRSALQWWDDTRVLNGAKY